MLRESPATNRRIAEGKPEVKALIYFSVPMAVGGDFRLSRYPNSANALATGLTTIGSGPSGTVGSASTGFSSPRSSLTFERALDGGAFSACSSPKDYANPSGGPHTFRVRGVDASGRAEYPAQRTWIADTTAPAIKPSAGSPGGCAHEHGGHGLGSSVEFAALGGWIP